jgi:excinuclease ABC subunit A
MPSSDIVIRGAREHNLRDVNLTLPRNKLICMTGVSGSGKSSLAFDTLYAEGQRRYVESLSSYARQFLGQMPKPDVDSVTGLAPSISIQQKAAGRNPRSTVGTITEIYDYLRVLFARVGTGHCEKCGRPITAQTVEQILEHILRIPDGERFSVLAPIVVNQKGEFRDLFEDLLKQGYLRARVDGKVVQLTDELNLDRHMRHHIEVVVDRLVAGKTQRTRLAEAVENALRLSGGTLVVSVHKEGGKRKAEGGEDENFSDQLYSAHYACTHCGISYEPPSPQLFSFNSPLGMCLDCTGLGMRHDFLLEKLIPDDKQSLWSGAIELIGPVRKIGRWRRHVFQGAAAAIEKDLGLPEDSLLKTPWSEVPADAKQMLLYGTGKRHITYSWKYGGGVWKHGGTWDGVIPELLDNYRKTGSPMRRRQLEKYMDFAVCHTCNGTRLNAQARNVRITSTSFSRADSPFSRDSKSSERSAAPATGRRAPLRKASESRLNGRENANGVALSLPEVCALSTIDAFHFFQELALDDTGRIIAEEALKEIRGRLGFLLRCGLDYLALDRTAPTLSGGESQRIRLAGQIGCGLVGVVYVLDEPSIGLHHRDNRLLLESLCDLRDQGNTVIVVEHDEETMRAADHIIDFGPGPGVRGGEIVAEGTYDTIVSAKKSLTGQYLSGQKTIPVPVERRPPKKTQQIKVTGATHHNLKGIDVEFPLGTFLCVTGVSGSGKSSLVNDILWETLNIELNKGNGRPGDHKRISGLTQLDKAIDIDQSPIGRTPRSNPATYVKLFDLIRDLFTKLPEAKVRGYKPGRFSFNVEDGRCEACEGYGSNKLEMDFLADVWVTCPVCNGKRFNHETLEVRYKGKSIADVLDMDVQEALEHFKNIPKIKRLLQTLHDVGLDYIKLGQPSPTLSGGEAQRIKLARELGKRSTGKTVYILDEPTTGLHFEDIHMLLKVLHGFVDAGNTVIVIEHNLDVIKTADWIIDLGPEGGAGGGTVVVAGTPEEVAACEVSHTGQALRKVPGLKAEGGRRKAEKKKLQHSNTPSLHSAPSNGRNGDTTQITIRGAAQHNLQHLDLTVPRDKLSVFCGPSGSGKSSLAMDTLYAEGQRRYVESLSAYARQFLGQMPKPRVEHIHGLSPAIAIEQKAPGTTPRSTVGTVTEVYDYLRILYARLGTLYCPDCEIPVETQTTDEVIEKILANPEDAKLLILAPQEVQVGQKYEELWPRLQGMGFLRVRIDGETHRLEEVPEIDRRRKHNVEIVVDRVTVNEKSRSRIADSVETAFDLGRGELRVAHVDSAKTEPDWKVDRYSLHYACQQCGRSFEELTPHNFSFNSPLGWCEACEGIGTEQGTNLAALIADPKKPLQEAALAAWPDPRSNPLFAAMLETMAAELNIPLDVPYEKLDPAQQRAILYGTGDRWFEVSRESRVESREKKTSGSGLFRFQYKGLYPAIEEAARVSYAYRQKLTDLIGEVPCSRCGGSRLREDAAAVRFQGKTLQQVCELPLNESLSFLRDVKLKKTDKKIAGDLLTEATSRLSFLVDVGLHYLSMSRTLPSLSGGEMQRIRLAGQIGRALTGVLYVLDEPTIGLHPRDNDRLLQALHRLRDLGNTLVLVEHDREVLDASDRLYDFGPGAGRFGGTITGEGTPKQLRRSKSSLTGQYLAGKKEIPIPSNRRMSSITEVGGQRSEVGKAKADCGKRKADKADSGLSTLDSRLSTLQAPDGWLELLGAKHHNLRDVDLRIPLGTFTCVTGVSGSGKSSLIEDTLARAVAKILHRSGANPAPYDELIGIERINKVIIVDQQPLGSTPASNPATYTGVFDHIRELFCRLPDAKVRGYRPARFSFNRPGGRCDDCEGNGQKCIEMHFLPDVWVECETCRGKRYNRETLDVKYRGQSIADVLDMSIGEAAELFQNIPRIRAYLATLCAIGLDYLTLGQPAPTLSGGEAQRVKLAAELARPDTGKTLYILDEPTTGLHFDDIAKLLKVLNSLVDKGNTVVVIEHNLDVIKTADWIIDVGPEAGHEGGYIVAQGTPEDVATHHESQASRGVHPPGTAKRSKTSNSSGGSARPGGLTPRLARFPSHTGRMLAPVLEHGKREERDVFDAKAVAKKQKGDVDLAQVGRGAKMPWQIDGRKWHLHERLAHNGKPCRWDGAALESVVDRIEARDGFAPANWNDRSTVEIKGETKVGTWFFHSHTGDEWILKLIFRVPKGTFTQDELARRLRLTSFDHIDEIPVYGRGDRVRVKNIKGPWQEITVTTHGQDDVETPAFGDFLADACRAFLGEARRAKQDPTDLMPWKVLGKKWHLLRKGFPSGKRVHWEAATLEKLFALLEDVFPDAEYDWSNKTQVNLCRNGREDVTATLRTKQREAIELHLFQPPGATALGRIAGLGESREIAPFRDGREVVKLRLKTTAQVEAVELRAFLAEWATLG